MTNKSKIRESKQEWKLYSSFIGFAIAGGVMFYGIKQTTVGTGTTVELILYSLVAEIVIATFACISIVLIAEGIYGSAFSLVRPILGTLWEPFGVRLDFLLLFSTIHSWRVNLAYIIPAQSTM
jgi:hypothetical protein